MYKMVPRIAVFSLLAGAAMLIACTDTPVEPVQERDAATPAFNFMNGPEFPGNSPVERWTGKGPRPVTDRDQGLRLRLFDALETWRCGGSGDDPDWWDYQEIWSNPDGIVKSLKQSHEVPVVVYPWPNPDPITQHAEFCEFLQTEVLATGTGTAVVNDNNVFWWTGTGGTNSYGIRVQATVETAEGDMYHVVGNNHYTIRGLCCESGGVDPADVWVERMSTIETIRYNLIKKGQN